MLRSSSLTSSNSVSDALTTVSHHYPTSSASTPTSGLVPELIVSPGRISQPFSANLPLEPLVGYFSSDEESEQKQTQPYKTEEVSGSKTPDSRKRKSLEFAYSESEVSDAATSNNQQHLRKRSPTVSQRATRKHPQSTSNKFARIESGRASATSDNTNMRAKNTGINSLTFGADISRSHRDARKRPLTPTAASATTKRLKKGPFIDESSSESDEYSQDGRGSDDHTATARPVPPRRNLSITRHDQKFDDKEHKLMPPGSNFQQREQDQVAKQRHSYPFAAKTVLPAQKGGLNRDRLKMLIAKKQGGGVVQEPEQQRMPSPMARGVDYRIQSFGGSDQVEIAEGTRKRRDIVSSVNEATRFNSIGPQARSPTPNYMSSSMQGLPNTTMRGTAPDSPFLNSKAPPTEAKTPSDTTRGSMQESLPSQNNSPERINRYRASGVCCSDTPTVRAANTPQPRNTPSSSSLRNIANVATSRPGVATREIGQVEVGKKREKTERSSTYSTKHAQRPEVGARYGHTLAQKRSDEVKKVSANVQQTPMATTDLKSPQRAVSQVQPPRSNLISSRTRTHDQVSTPSDTSLSKGSAASQISSNRSKESTVPEKKEAGHVAPIARLTPSKDTPVTATNPSADTDTLNHARLLSQRKCAAAPTSRSALSLPTDKDHGHDNQGSIASKTHLPGQEKILKDPVIEASASASCSTDTQNNHTPRAHDHKFSSMDGVEPTQGEVTLSMEENVALCSGASENMTSTETPAHDTLPVGTEDGSKCPLSSSPTIDGPTHRMDPSTTCAMDVGHHSRNASPSKTFEPLPTSTEPHTQSEVPVAMMVHSQPTSVSTLNPTAGEVYEESEALDDMDVCIANQTTALTGPLEPSPLLHEDRHDTSSSGGLLVVSTNNARQSEPMPSDLDQPALQENGENTPPLLVHGATAISEQAVGYSGILKDVHEKNTLSVTSPGAGKPAKETQPESTTAPLMAESTQTVASGPDTVIQRSILSLEPTTKSTPPPTAPTLNTQADPDSDPTNTLTLPAEITLPSPTTPPTAEPYFEYSIHQTLSSPYTSTPVPPSTELTAQPLTSSDAANAQLETLFRNTRDSFNLLDLQCTRTTQSIDEHGLATYEATFTSVEDQSKVLGLKIWVSRNIVGVHANHTPSIFEHARLVSRTVYLLCLSRLLPAVSPCGTSRASSPSSSSSSSSVDDDDDNNTTTPQPLRIHHPLPPLTTALHTTLDAANRAARRVQIALSHEREPRGMQAQWQMKDLQELDERLERLRREAGNIGAVVIEEQRADSANTKGNKDGEGTAKGRWTSTFNGLGLGSDKFELRVEAVRLVGPRNI